MKTESNMATIEVVMPVMLRPFNFFSLPFDRIAKIMLKLPKIKGGKIKIIVKIAKLPNIRDAIINLFGLKKECPCPSASIFVKVCIKSITSKSFKAATLSYFNCL